MEGPEDIAFPKAIRNVLVRGSPAAFKGSVVTYYAGQNDGKRAGHRAGLMMGSEVKEAKQ